MRRLSVFRRRVGTSAASQAAPDASTVAAKLQNDVSNVAARIVPWFTSRMPPQYFRLVSEQAQQRHLRALVGLAVSDRQWRERSGTQHWSVPEISLHHRNGGWTYISDGTGCVTRRLESQLSTLPEDMPLSHVLAFTTDDGRISINMFTSSLDHDIGESPRYTGGPAHEQEARARLGDYLRSASPAVDEARLEEFIHRCPSDFVVQHVGPLFHKQMRLYYVSALRPSRPAVCNPPAVHVDGVARRRWRGRRTSPSTWTPSTSTRTAPRCSPRRCAAAIRPGARVLDNSTRAAFARRRRLVTLRRVRRCNARSRYSQSTASM